MTEERKEPVKAILLLEGKKGEPHDDKNIEKIVIHGEDDSKIDLVVLVEALAKEEVKSVVRVKEDSSIIFRGTAGQERTLNDIIETVTREVLATVDVSDFEFTRGAEKINLETLVVESVRATHKSLLGKHAKKEVLAYVTSPDGKNDVAEEISVVARDSLPDALKTLLDSEEGKQILVSRVPALTKEHLDSGAEAALSHHLDSAKGKATTSASVKEQLKEFLGTDEGKALLGWKMPKMPKETRKKGPPKRTLSIGGDTIDLSGGPPKKPRHREFVNKLSFSACDGDDLTPAATKDALFTLNDWIGTLADKLIELGKKNPENKERDEVQIFVGEHKHNFTSYKGRGGSNIVLYLLGEFRDWFLENFHPTVDENRVLGLAEDPGAVNTWNDVDRE